MSTALVRIRFSTDLVTRLDGLVAQVRTTAKRHVSRAATVRALVALHLDTPAPDLARAVEADTMRHGRRPGWNRGAS